MISVVLYKPRSCCITKPLRLIAMESTSMCKLAISLKLNFYSFLQLACKRHLCYLVKRLFSQSGFSCVTLLL